MNQNVITTFVDIKMMESPKTEWNSKEEEISVSRY